MYVKYTNVLVHQLSRFISKAVARLIQCSGGIEPVLSSTATIKDPTRTVE